MTVQVNGETYTALQLKFVNEYFTDYNATRACERAGYRGNVNSLATQGHALLRLPKIAKLIKKRLESDLMTKEEVIQRLARMARGVDVAHYVITELTEKGVTVHHFDLERFKADGMGFLVKSVTNRGPSVKFDFYDAQKALEILAKHHALLVDVLVNVSDDLTDEKSVEARRRRVMDLLKAVSERTGTPVKSVSTKVVSK